MDDIDLGNSTERQLSTEELLSRIRAEAQFLEQTVVEPSVVSHEPEVPSWLPPSFEIPVKHRYHINEFLIYDDLEFVLNAYRGILRREADESGLDAYVTLLRKRGAAEKMGILLSLLESEEARAIGVYIEGIRWERLGHRSWLFRGRLARAVLGVLRRLQRSDLFDYTRENEGQSRQFQRQASDFLSTQASLLQHMQQRAVSQAAEQARLNASLEDYRRDTQMVRQDLLGQQQRLNVLLADLRDKVARGGLSPEQEFQLATHASAKLDAFYLAFENAARGDEADIREQLSVYLPYLTEVGVISESAPVLDIGSGRGEWLGLLRDEGLAARGVDISPVLAQHCSDQGLEVVVADAVAHLRTLADASLGAVTSFHVIEHLPFETLYDLVEECHRVLVPGGLVIFETPNPENLMVGSHTFYHDPTHRNPITPTLIDFLLRHLGLDRIEIMRLHPYPAEARVVGMDPLTDRVNGAFCGPQDFAILGYKPA